MTARGDIPAHQAPPAPSLTNVLHQIFIELKDNDWNYVEEVDGLRWFHEEDGTESVFMEIHRDRAIINIWAITELRIPYMTMDLRYHADPVKVFRHLVNNVRMSAANRGLGIGTE